MTPLVGRRLHALDTHAYLTHIMLPRRWRAVRCHQSPGPGAHCRSELYSLLLCLFVAVRAVAAAGEADEQEDDEAGQQHHECHDQLHFAQLPPELRGQRAQLGVSAGSNS